MNAMKKSGFFLSIFLVFSIFLNAAESNKAEIRVLTSTPFETILEINFPPIQTEGFDAQIIKMGELEVLEKDGFPPLPYVSGIIAISDRGSFSGEVGKIDEYSIHLRKPISFSIDAYPEKQLYLDTPQILRDYRILRFQFLPVQYVPESNEIRITRSATIRITMTGSKGKN
ncbi:MAG: hypothetical protein E3J87_02865, partial [Candidatus Cloacimonadota bacterium]